MSEAFKTTSYADARLTYVIRSRVVDGELHIAQAYVCGPNTWWDKVRSLLRRDRVELHIKLEHKDVPDAPPDS